MNYVLYSQIWLIPLFFTNSSLAQLTNSRPHYTLTVYADGLPVDPQLGIPVLAKAIRLKRKLTPASIKQYPLLESEVIFMNVKVSVVRYGRKRSGISCKGPTIPTFFSLSTPEPGDICLLELVDVRTITKNGVTRQFDGLSVYKIPFYPL